LLAGQKTNRETFNCVVRFWKPTTLFYYRGATISERYTLNHGREAGHLH